MESWTRIQDVESDISKMVRLGSILILIFRFFLQYFDGVKNSFFRNIFEIEKINNSCTGQWVI